MNDGRAFYSLAVKMFGSPAKGTVGPRYPATLRANIAPS
jgi:hypothetical protein